MEDTQSIAPPPEVNEWTLDQGAEYRFELDIGSSLAIKLVQGEAEIFGSELALRRTYLFGDECKAAVFSWQGCTLEMSKPLAEYVADETPMNPYLNVHLALEHKRVLANRAARDSPTPNPVPHDQRDSSPPRIMVIGPENSGKTTAAKILVNYAVRSPAQWSPILVNLDTNDGGHTVPGTLSAVSVASPLLSSSPATTLGATATSAPTALASSALTPLVYWFGHAHPRKSPALMEKRIRDLAHHVHERQRIDSHSRASGLVIDTSAAFAAAAPYSGLADQKYPLVKAAVEAFDVNIIVVVGHEKLNVEMQRLFGTYTGVNNSISIIKVPKSGGVVDLDFAYVERLHAHQLHTYFYGTPLYFPPNMPESAAVLGGEASAELTLSPYSSVIGFDDITIYRIGGDTMAPSSALPIGLAPTVSETKPMRVDPALPGSGLLNTLLAVVTPIPAVPNPEGTKSQPTEEDVLERDVAGFILVTALDVHARKMTILSPSPGSLIGRIAVLGSFEWTDQ